METLHSYEPNKMSRDMEALDVSNLLLPQVTPEYLHKTLNFYLRDITYDEWMSLDTNGDATEVADVLACMCCTVIIEISTVILEVVEPEVIALGRCHSSGNNVTVQGECRYCRVTEEDIEACIRSSLYDYFEEAQAITEENFCNFEKIVKLFSAEITRKVNSLLAQNMGSDLSPDTYDKECILEIMHNIGEIFKSLLQDDSRDKLARPDWNSMDCLCSDEDAENVEQDSTEISERSACMDNLSPEPAPQLSDCSESDNFISSHMIQSSSSHPPRPEHLINRTFLTVILAKLVDHIAVETRTSLENVDLDRSVYRVTKNIWGMLNLALLENVHNLHIFMYKDLCQKFRSKYMLQAVIESGDEAFESSVSVTLVSLLLKFNGCGKTWKPFKPWNLSPVFEGQTPEPYSEERSGKVSPLPESQTPEPYSEERSGKVSPLPESQTPEPYIEERSEQTTSSPSNRSLWRTIRKKISRWASNVSKCFKGPGQSNSQP